MDLLPPVPCGHGADCSAHLEGHAATAAEGSCLMRAHARAASA